MKRLFIVIGIALFGITLYGIYLLIKINGLPGVYVTNYSASELTRIELKKDHTCSIPTDCKWKSNGIKLYITYKFTEEGEHENTVVFTLTWDGISGLNSVYTKEKPTGES